MRRMGWVALALMVVAFTRPAAASCVTCSSEMYCADSPRGAWFCLGDGNACVMAGRCMGSGGGGFLDGGMSMIQVSLLEDSPGLMTLGVSRRERAVGPVAAGRQATRIARAATGGGVEPAILYSGLGYGEGVTVAFRSKQGDGFTLRRDADGRGARLTVRSLLGGRPGRVLANERVDENDALLVRVTLDGRTRLLVLQAATLPKPEAMDREELVKRELRDAAFGRPADARPPFELRALDR